MMNKRKVCSNCKNNYIDGDKYCRYCGAPMGTPVFIKFEYSTIYGPMPIDREHVCQKCGYTWKTHLMVDMEKWCPRCGGITEVTEKWNERSPIGNRTIRVIDIVDMGKKSDKQQEK